MQVHEELKNFAGEAATLKEANQGAVKEFNAWSKLNPTSDIVQMSTCATNFEVRDASGKPHVTFCFVITMLIHTPA